MEQVLLDIISFLQASEHGVGIAFLHIDSIGRLTITIGTDEPRRYSVEQFVRLINE